MDLLVHRDGCKRATYMVVMTSIVVMVPAPAVRARLRLELRVFRRDSGAKALQHLLQHAVLENA